MIKKIYLILLFFFISSFMFAQGNPLFSQPEQDTTSSQEAVEQKKEQNLQSSNKFIKIPLLHKIQTSNARLQQKIKSRLADLAFDYNSSEKATALFFIFLFAFLYGIFHSLGPGHGKVFVFSYILTEKPKIGKAIFTSYAIAFVHGLSGLIVALVIALSLKTYASEASNIDSTSRLISQISYGIIIILGVALFLKSLLKKEHNHKHSGKLSSLPFILSVGAVPCPGTIIIVTFLSSLGLLKIGIFSAFFIILGMGITISTIGIISLISKELVARIYHKKTGRYEKLYRIITLFGAALLIILGIWFLLGSF